MGAKGADWAISKIDEVSIYSRNARSKVGRSPRVASPVAALRCYLRLYMMSGRPVTSLPCAEARLNLDNQPRECGR